MDYLTTERVCVQSQKVRKGWGGERGKEAQAPRDYLLLSETYKLLQDVRSCPQAELLFPDSLSLVDKLVFEGNVQEAGH